MMRVFDIARELRAFRRDERGNVAMLTALMFVPLLGIVFTSLEFADDVSVRSDLQNAADEAALAAVASKTETWRNRQKKARSLFMANFQRMDRVASLQWKLNRAYTSDGMTVNYQARAKMASLFGGLTPFGDRTMVVESAAIRYSDNRYPPRLISTKDTAVGVDR